MDFKNPIEHGTVSKHRPMTDAESLADFAALHALQDEIQNASLALCKVSIPLQAFFFGQGRRIMKPFKFFTSFRYGFEELRPVNGLLQKMYGSMPHGAYGSIDGSMTRNENNGQLNAPPAHFVLQLQSVHRRHQQVQHDTAGFGICGFQKSFRACKCLCAPTGAFKQNG